MDGYFLAERFPVKDNDLIYVANARMTDLEKFFTLIGWITGPVIGGQWSSVVSLIEVSGIASGTARRFLGKAPASPRAAL